MSYQAGMILLLLLSMKRTFGLYIYIRFCPRHEIMTVLAEGEAGFEERFPPMALLNPFGRRMALFTYAFATTSLLIVSELYRNL